MCTRWLVLSALLGLALGELCPLANGVGERTADGACAVVACHAGHTPAGGFCAPCAIGLFKTNDRAEPCAPCANAPAHGVYTRMGGATADCPYECAPGFFGNACLSPYMYAVLCIATLGVVVLGLYVHVEMRRRAQRRLLKRR